MSALATLRQERNEILGKARDLAAAVEKEGRGFTDDEKGQADDLLAKAREKGEEIGRFESIAATQAEVDEVLKADAAADLNDAALTGANVGMGSRRKSVGRVFTDSDGYKALLKAHNGHISETTKGIQTPPVNIGGFKALLTGGDHDTSAGVLVQPDNIGVQPYPTVPLGLRSLITVGQTGSDKIEYAQVLPRDVEGGSVNNAAGVPEATETGGTSGTKPESSLRFRKASADVITVAHWLPATKRALSDAGQLRTLIDNFLRDGVAAEFERQILTGDSDNPVNESGEEFDGILNTSGVQDVEAQGDITQTARRIIRRVGGVGGQVTAFAVSPEVNEELDLMQTSDGRYLGGGPFAGGASTLWGRPRVEVPGLSGQDAIIGGDFRTAVLWDREQTTITATDSHADFFVRNLAAILGEARAAFGIINPQLLAIGATA